MANDTTSDRLWILDTAGSVQAAVGTPVIVRKVCFFPTTKAHTCVIQEYSTAAVLRTAIYIKANSDYAFADEVDFGPGGRFLNGFKLSTLDSGSVYVYLGKD